jgi:hypothetical protein
MIKLGFLAGFAMDETFCRQQLKTLRELTKSADPFIKQRLIKLAIRYEKELIMASSKRDAISGPLNAASPVLPGAATAFDRGSDL